MSEDITFERLENLKLQALDFQAKATELSNAIEQIQAGLRTVPNAYGRVETAAGYLTFDKGCLFFAPDDVEGVMILTNCNVNYKVLAAQMIPELLDSVEHNLTEKVNDVTDAVECLAELNFPITPDSEEVQQ